MIKYYINKTTGNIIGITNMRQLITHPTENSIILGYVGYSYQIIYDMICPNVLLGNGIKSFTISNIYLTKNYKRIKREIALTKHPEFKQYVYSDLVKESEDRNIDKLEILHEQVF